MPFAYADRKCPGWSVWDGRQLCCSHLSQFRGISEPGGIFSASTCQTFAAFLSQVACFRLHLSHFRGISVPGGMSAAPTCHSFADFLCQAATLLLPPVTLLRHFRARWHFFGLHLPHFRSIPEPGGVSAASTCHTFAAFLCQVAMSDTTHDAGEIKFCEKIYEKIWREKKSQYLCSPFRK